MVCSYCISDKVETEIVDGRNMYVCDKCHLIWYDAPKARNGYEHIMDKITEGVRTEDSIDYSWEALINTLFRSSDRSPKSEVQLAQWAAKNRLATEFLDRKNTVRFTYAKRPILVSNISGEVKRESIAIPGISDLIIISVVEIDSEFRISAFIRNQRVPFPTYVAPKSDHGEPGFSLTLFRSNLLSSPRAIRNRLIDEKIIQTDDAPSKS